MARYLLTEVITHETEANSTVEARMNLKAGQADQIGYSLTVSEMEEESDASS